MSCPEPSSDPNACEYNSKKNVCRKPNPWVQHLILHGKQGKTLAQIRSSYVRGRSPAQTCATVRENMRDRKLRMGEDPRYFILNLPLRSANPQTVMRRIQHKLHKDHGIEYNWSSSNYLTVDVLQKVYREVDEHFSAGDIGRWFRAGGRQLKFYVIDDPSDKSIAFYAAHPWTHPQIVPPPPASTNCIVFNRQFWKQDNYPIACYDGDEDVQFKNMLESLIYIQVHSLCHALCLVSNHGVQWQTLMRNILGTAGTRFKLSNNIYINCELDSRGPKKTPLKPKTTKPKSPEKPKESKPSPKREIVSLLDSDDDERPVKSKPALRLMPKSYWLTSDSMSNELMKIAEISRDMCVLHAVTPSPDGAFGFLKSLVIRPHHAKSNQRVSAQEVMTRNLVAFSFNLSNNAHGSHWVTLIANKMQHEIWYFDLFFKPTAANLPRIESVVENVVAKIWPDQAASLKNRKWKIRLFHEKLQQMDGTCGRWATVVIREAAKLLNIRGSANITGDEVLAKMAQIKDICEEMPVYMP